MNNSKIAIGLFAQFLECSEWPASIWFKSKHFSHRRRESSARPRVRIFAAAFFSISLNISLVVTTFSMLFAVIIRRVVVGEKRQTVQSVRTCQTGFPNPYQRFISLSTAEKNVWFKTGTTSHCQKDGWEVSPLRRRRVRSLNIEKKISSLNRKLNLESRLGIKIYEKEAIGLNSDNWKLLSGGCLRVN